MLHCVRVVASLLKLQNPCAGRLDSSVVVVYCLCDVEAELFIEGACLIVGGLDMKVDGFDLDALFEGLQLDLLAVLVLLGLGSRCVLVDDLDLFAGADVVEDVLQKGRCDAKTTVRSENAKSHDVDANSVLGYRLETTADGADSDIVEESQLADLGSIRVENILVEAFRVLNGEEDAVELAKLSEVVGCELSNVDSLGQQ